ncbi:hypothetical protein TrST_g7943 [Triparma strigata]|uniref:Cyclin N-terminal domain-containing protein n=1 Tax=Triparma strigata TaxID=1606541 RepID=A0A9W7BWA8_9STRA|nr:hypothetical protein TrST_g7943 [Triparma strigata]
MGASGSVATGKNGSSLFYDKSPSQTPQTVSTFASLSGGNSRPPRLSKGSKGTEILPKSKGAGIMERKVSNQEKVHELVRREVAHRILAGKSLMVSTPSVPGETPESSSAESEGLKKFRSTLFDHIAMPSPLPRSLCSEDVSDFKSVSVWEEHLRQTKPWQDNNYSSRVSLISGLQTEQVMKRRSDPTGLSSNTDWKTNPIEAFRSPRNNPRRVDSGGTALPTTPPSPSAPPTFSSTNERLLEESAKSDYHSKSPNSRRGKTFVSLPMAKRVEKRRSSVHKPDVQKCILGLGFLLSYLIEEPPEKYVKNQCWDIFTVPGDKKKIRKPINSKERKENAGKAIVSAADVDDFLTNLYKICQWTSECHIIAFILMIRLVNQSGGKICLHRYNWQCMLVVSLMISQKLWDDVSLNNVDFPQVWRMVAPNGGDMDLKDVNFMEREFLSILSYSVGVNMRVYTSVYYDVMALAVVSDPQQIDELRGFVGSSSGGAMKKFTNNSYHLVTSKKKIMDGEEGGGEEGDEGGDGGGGGDGTEDESDEYVGIDKDSAIFNKSAKVAHMKYERRNTVDILSKTPPRNARGLQVR